MRTRLQRIEEVARRKVVCGHPGLYSALAEACWLLDPRSYLEVGVADGASVITVVDNSPSLSRIVLIDKWREGEWHGRSGHGHIKPTLAGMGYAGDVLCLDGDSREVLPRLDPKMPFDLILIDGDHSPEAAARDLENAYPLMAPRGILVFDDATRPGLPAVWSDFCRKHPVRELLTVDDEIDAVALALHGEKAASA